ncbi:MAG: transposase [Nitrospirales bacterium]|nr:transposase [Nitrospirales bacterium]
MKQGENQYGYKNHVNVDKTHKLLRQYTVTDAAGHNSQVFEKILLSVEAGWDVWADSASRSIEIEAHLKATGLRSRFTGKGIAISRSPLKRRATTGVVRAFAHESNMSLAIRSPRWAENRFEPSG